MNLDRVIAVRNKKTVYRDGDACIKVFNTDYSKSDVLNEALNQARVEETGLHIPHIREVMMIEGKWAIVTDYIKGKTLAQMMQEDRNRLDAYMELLVSLQMTVQAKSCPLLTRLHDSCRRKIAMSDIDAVTRYDLQARLEAMAHHHKLCHGDFNPHNIVLAEDGTPYLLDWSHATQGNASADVANTYLDFLLEGENELAEKYLDLYYERGGTEKQHVQKWLPIVAGAKHRDCNPAKQEKLMQWINAID